MRIQLEYSGIVRGMSAILALGLTAMVLFELGHTYGSVGKFNTVDQYENLRLEHSNLAQKYKDLEEHQTKNLSSIELLKSSNTAVRIENENLKTRNKTLNERKVETESNYDDLLRKYELLQEAEQTNPSDPEILCDSVFIANSVSSITLPKQCNQTGETLATKCNLSEYLELPKTCVIESFTRDQSGQINQINLTDLARN